MNLRITIINDNEYVIRKSPDGGIWSHPHMLRNDRPTAMRALRDAGLSEDSVEWGANIEFNCFANGGWRVGSHLYRLSRPNIRQYRQIGRLSMSYGTRYNKKKSKFIRCDLEQHKSETGHTS